MFGQLTDECLPYFPERSVQVGFDLLDKLCMYFQVLLNFSESRCAEIIERCQLIV
jgi:hypothetical protein